jgi:hypothetical protein
MDEGDKPAKDNLQRGYQASPGTQRANTNSEDFPLYITEVSDKHARLKMWSKDYPKSSFLNAALQW